MRAPGRHRVRDVRVRDVTRDVRVLRPVTRALGALYLADERVTLNVRAASAWGEQVSALDVTQGTGVNQPSVIPGAVGARDAIRFDGSNDQMSRAIAAGLRPSGRGLSVVFVAQGRSGSTGDYPVIASTRPWSAGNDAGWAVSANGSGSGGVLTTHYDSGVTEAGGWDHAAAPANSGLSTTRRELWCVVFDVAGSKLTYYRNGAVDKEHSPITYPVTNPIVPTTDFRIGADLAVGAATRLLAMDLFALAIHTDPLTQSEVDAYAAAWMPHFGVSL